MMDKSEAIGLFGSVTATAQAVGVSQPDVSQWRDPLPARIVDRIVAALVRHGRIDDALRVAQKGNKE